MNGQCRVQQAISTSRDRRLAVLLVALAWACAIAPSRAQEPGAYPSRNVQIVVPYTPGTGADILARVLGPKLAERWKTGVVIENRTGASGVIGAELVSKAPGDGHVLLLTATSFGTTPALNSRLPYDPVKSFVPVVLVATSGLALVVHPQLPVKSVREFVALAKRHPGQLYYSSPGNGGPQHLAMELLKLEAKIDIVHVPYKGAAGALTDVMGGHVQAMISALQTAAPFVHGGKLRMLGVMSARRSPAFPDVPTLKEQGYPGVEIETWYGMFAPAGTPAPVVARINAEVNAQIHQPDLTELLAKQGMIAAGGGAEAFGDMVKRELARWQRVVAAAGIKAD